MRKQYSRPVVTEINQNDECPLSKEGNPLNPGFPVSKALLTLCGLGKAFNRTLAMAAYFVSCMTWDSRFVKTNHNFTKERGNKTHRDRSATQSSLLLQP